MASSRANGTTEPAATPEAVNEPRAESQARVAAAMGPASAANMAAEIWRATSAADLGRRPASDDNSLAITA